MGLYNNISIADYSNSKVSTFANFRNYFLVLMMLLVESSPFFLLARQIPWIISFSIIFLITLGNKKIFNQKIISLLIAVYILMLLQILIYKGSITPASLYKPIYIFYTPFLLFTLMGIRYFKYLFNVLFFIVVYTTILYLLHTFFGPINKALNQAFDAVFPYSWADYPRTILIYSIPRESGYAFMRNSGIFHEPGAYSIYLMLAILINTLLTKNTFHWKNIFLALIVLSTYSTTGYIMLFIFLAYALIRARIPAFIKPVIIIPAAIVVFNYYQDTAFLGVKIEQHYTSQLESIVHDEKDVRGRFYSMGMSVKAFLSAPVTGRGILADQQYDVGEVGSFGYGLPGLFAIYGIFFGLFYVYYFYRGFRKISRIYYAPKLYTQTAFIVINLGLATQSFFYHTPFIYFFIIGLFLPVVIDSNSNKNKVLIRTKE